MYRSCIFGLLATGIGVVGVAQAAGDLQAGLGIQRNPIFRDAAANDGAKVDGGPVSRCVPLRDYLRTFWNCFLPAEGKWARDGFPGAVHLEARLGGGIDRFLGRRSGGAILAL